MSPTATRWLVTLAVLVCAAVSAVPAQAFYDQPYTPVLDPTAACAGDAWAMQAAANYTATGLNANLSPADGATVQAGTPEIFSGPSSSPLTFSVASSPSSLASPDIEHGTGSASPPNSPPSLSTFSSSNATARPGTVYWTASFTIFPNADSCANPPIVYTTPVRTLTVTPPPPPPVQVSASSPAGFKLAHPTVAYQIHCTTSCSGDTYYLATVSRHHGKLTRIPAFDLPTTPVSITAAAGGSQQFSHHYSGRALRTLRSILHSGGVVKLQLSVKVTDAAGNVARANSTARLHA